MRCLQMQVQKRVALRLVITADGDVLMDSNRMDRRSPTLPTTPRRDGGQGSILITVARPSADEAAEFLKNSHEWICIEFADSGPGIPEEIASACWSRFLPPRRRPKLPDLVCPSPTGYLSRTTARCGLAAQRSLAVRRSGSTCPYTRARFVGAQRRNDNLSACTLKLTSRELQMRSSPSTAIQSTGRLTLQTALRAWR